MTTFLKQHEHMAYAIVLSATMPAMLSLGAWQTYLFAAILGIIGSTLDIRARNRRERKRAG